MPLLEITCNTRIDDKAALAQNASRVVAGMLGKPESYVMIKIEDNACLIFGGNEEPAAHLKLKSLGMDESNTTDYSTHLCGFVQNILDIPPSRTYIEFCNPERHMWGWDSRTF